jgi:hypothetical protein
MKPFVFLKTVTLALIVLFSSCKKEKNTDDPTTQPTEITVLKSNQWKVDARQSLFMAGSALGGAYQTVDFSIQNSRELRWYTWYNTMVNWIGHTEMTLNTQGKVVINKDLKAPAYGGEFKAIVGADTWKINRSFDRADQIFAFKNDQIVDLSQYHEGQTNIKNVQAADDGILNSSNTMGDNSVAHYNYATQKWKNNTFWGNNFVSLRYKGRTYVISFTRLTSANGMTILEESDNRVVVQDTQIPTIYTVHYPMTILKSIPGEYGFVLHTSAYDDNVFVVFHSHTSNIKYGVVKVNLTNLTGQLIQAPEFVVPFGQSPAVEVDEAGNLYVVEVRTENTNPFYNIRKYAAGGGSEVILKEEELIPNTQIQGLKIFNRKLHVAIINREEMPDNNPNDNYFPSTYHMQIISPK